EEAGFALGNLEDGDAHHDQRDHRYRRVNQGHADDPLAVLEVVFLAESRESRHRNGMTSVSPAVRVVSSVMPFMSSKRSRHSEGSRVERVEHNPNSVSPSWIV